MLFSILKRMSNCLVFGKMWIAGFFLFSILPPFLHASPDAMLNPNEGYCSAEDFEQVKTELLRLLQRFKKEKLDRDFYRRVHSAIGGDKKPMVTADIMKTLPPRKKPYKKLKENFRSEFSVLQHHIENATSPALIESFSYSAQVLRGLLVKKWRWFHPKEKVFFSFAAKGSEKNAERQLSLISHKISAMQQGASKKSYLKTEQDRLLLLQEGGDKMQFNRLQSLRQVEKEWSLLACILAKYPLLSLVFTDGHICTTADLARILRDLPCLL